MIRPYTIFKVSTGQILRTIMCPVGSANLQLEDSTQDFIEGYYQDDLYYVSNYSIVSFPPRPSENYIFDFSIKQWVDPRTLDQLKDLKWNTVKSKRQQIEEGGFVWNNYTFDSNLTSQSRIQGACQLALMDTANFTIDWTLQNNLVLTLSGTDMLQVGIAMGEHINSTHIHARNLRTDIYACTTKEQLELIGDW